MAGKVKKIIHKRTGLIVDLSKKGLIKSNHDGLICIYNDNAKNCLCYDSLDALYKEWEDYKEPKKYYYINDFGAIQREYVGKSDIDEVTRKDFGNHFDTEEAAEKAVKKQEAKTRLIKNGFRFEGFEEKDRGHIGDLAIYAHIEPNYTIEYPELDEDLYLLFGGKE